MYNISLNVVSSNIKPFFFLVVNLFQFFTQLLHITQSEGPGTINILELKYYITCSSVVLCVILRFEVNLGAARI